MVAVAQLVEPRIVDPVVVGSSPISHPISGGTPCRRKENFQTLMSESSAPVPPASAPLTALASPAKGGLFLNATATSAPEFWKTNPSAASASSAPRGPLKFSKPASGRSFPSPRKASPPPTP